MSSTNDGSLLLPHEKKIRNRQHARVLFSNDNSIEDILKSDDNINSYTSDPTLNMKKIVTLEKEPSLFSFLKIELTRGYLLEHDEERFSARREKVYSFMKIPREVEKFMTYGFLQCADSFLFVYTFLPMRFILALWAVITRPIAICFGFQKKRNNKILMPAEICDLLKASILILCSLMMFYIDTNMMYHLIKSQSVIKLYIFYNMLEVGDRLFSAFGQDTIDALFWTATEPRDRRREHFGTIPHLLFAIAYVFLHSLLVLFQATTLNVAINSSNKALLTIMMSNNFVELKGAVFKKFDKNNLFQVSCSDVRERFHLVILLFIVVLQTMREYSWKEDRFWVLVPDCFLVLSAEILVDWIKHAFITRFNELQVDVYKDYTTSLAYDMAQTRQKHAFSDHSDLVARRMGFIPLPLGVVMIRVLVHAISIEDAVSILIFVIAYLCLTSLRVLNSVILLGKASDFILQHKQEKQISVNSPSVSLRANSPIPIERSNGIAPLRDFRDIATSPLKPTTDFTISAHQPNNNIGNNQQLSERELLKKSTSSIDNHANCNLGSAAIFSNSAVDLKNVCLNEELLRVDSEALEIQTIDATNEIVTRSFPNIHKEIVEDLVENPDAENVTELMMKRSESEPSLLTMSDGDSQEMNTSLGVRLVN